MEVFTEDTFVLQEFNYKIIKFNGVCNYTKMKPDLPRKCLLYYLRGVSQTLFFLVCIFCINVVMIYRKGSQY